MKKIGLVMTIVTVISNVSLAREMAYVNTPFWRAPYFKNYTLKLQNVSSSLSQECSRFKKSVFSDDNTLKIWNPKYFDMFRTITAEMNAAQDVFYTEFKVVEDGKFGLLSVKDLKLLHDESSRTREEDKLPMYSQNTSEVHFEPMLGVDFVPESIFGRYTDVTKKFQLPILPAQWQLRDDGLYLIVRGKDVACDLASGQGSFELKSQARVTINLKGLFELTDLYSEIGKRSLVTLSKKISKKKKHPRVSSAKVILSIFSYLDELKKFSLDQNNDYANSIFETFFDPKTGLPNELWSPAFGVKTLLVEGYSRKASVQIKFEGIQE
jgi:hypothetical protein